MEDVVYEKQEGGTAAPQVHFQHTYTRTHTHTHTHSLQVSYLIAKGDPVKDIHENQPHSMLSPDPLQPVAVYLFVHDPITNFHQSYILTSQESLLLLIHQIYIY